MEYYSKVKNVIVSNFKTLIKGDDSPSSLLKIVLYFLYIRPNSSFWDKVFYYFNQLLCYLDSINETLKTLKNKEVKLKY